MQMERGNRFVAYAFSVGDIFIELDEEFRLTRIDGAMAWLGLREGELHLERPFSDFLDRGDWELVRSAIGFLSNGARLGPIRVNLGLAPEARQPVGLFLSRLDGLGDAIHIVAISAQRLYGSESPPLPRLADRESFFSRLPDLIEGADGNYLLISLVQIPPDADPEERCAFERRLMVLTQCGGSAADLGNGRYAIIHAKGSDLGAARSLVETLSGDGPRTLESATLPATGPNSGDKDAARALVYSIRKFADHADDFDLSDLSEHYVERMQETRDRIDMLRNLLEHDRFRLAYQPIVSLKDRKVHHLEALVRFDMRGGAPYELITFAEDVGLISEFDTAILRKVTRKLRSLARQGSNLGIAVNLSARSLTSEIFRNALEKHLGRNAAYASHLMVEVTESARVQDLTALASALEMIRGLGFQVCLDDFGAGVSGFQYLRHLKVDLIKIDGSYIRGAETCRETRAFLHSMVTLCRDLGIETVGEWIENREQAKLLTSFGVTYGQGYYFGRPSLSFPKAAAA